MRRALGAVLAVLIAPSALVAADGRLEAAREQVRAPDQPASASSGSGRPHDGSRGASISSDDDGIVVAIALGLLAPFIVPNVAMGDQDFTMPPLAPRPYAAAPAEGGWWTARVGAEYAYEQDQLHRFSASAAVDTRYRLGLCAGWDRYEQRGRARDHLDLGDAELTLRFAQCARGTMHLGLGVRWLTDRVGTETGFTITYGGEFLPIRPWTAAFRVEAGRLGDASVLRARASIGAQVLGARPYVGYGFLAIGSVDFHGPLAGLTYSF